MSQKKSEDAVRGENRPAETGSTRFKCQTPGCGIVGCAEEMYNLSGDPMAMTREKLLERVRCKACAEKIAGENGKRLREPGCGCYPLCRTLKKLEEVDEVRAHREDTARWVEGLKAARQNVVREADKQRQIDEARLARREKVLQYARRYAESATCGTDAMPLPAARLDSATHLCGLPLVCCRHDQPVDRFITVMGEVVGICRLASAVFTEVFKESDGRDQRYRKLLSTGNLEQAQFFAAKWLGEDPDANGEE
jgi:hypothetical protein